MKISLYRPLSQICALVLVLTISACGQDSTENSASTKNLFPWNRSRTERKVAVTEEIFNQIGELAHKFHEPQIKAEGDIFKLHLLWKDNSVSSQASRDPQAKKAYVSLLGGFARSPEIIPEAMAIVACHEFSHLYAGPPYFRGYERLSAEGMCDYIGSGGCLRFVLDSLPSSIDVEKESSATIRDRCSKYPTGSNSYSYCVRGMNGALSLTSLLSKLNEEEFPPKLETPDVTVVKETETGYPETVQCRLDTISNALQGKEKPLCWFNPNQPLRR